jgi:hypothetical protein
LNLCIAATKILKIISTLMIFFWTHSHADENTLCLPHEEVYFSCRSSGKTISLCASGNISPDNGYVRYRFGAINNIELEFPKKSLPPRKIFYISEIHEGNISSTHLKFQAGRYDYVLYQGDVSGIYVKRNYKTVSNRMCDLGSVQRLNHRAFRGIQTVAPIDEIDD